MTKNRIVFHPTKWCILMHCYVLLYTIMSQLCLYVSMFWSKQTSGMGNTLRVSSWWRILAAWLTWSVNDMDLWFLGSAHCVPTGKMCLWWMSMACRESNSFLQWTHLKPNAIGNRLGPSGFPLPALWRMRWIAFNWLQFSASGQIDANCTEIARN